tara:strand:- start:1212 stop:1622 length:411 start_codon:yes stop_codon:yes gene_type:complete
LKKNFNLVRSFIRKNKTPKLFIFFGLINVFFTITTLQISLIFLNVWISTFISQAVNLILGLNFYGKKVFKLKRIAGTTIFYYCCLSFFIWITNWLGIELVSSYVRSSNLSALILAIPIASFSYFCQKKYIFKTYRK